MLIFINIKKIGHIVSDTYAISCTTPFVSHPSLAKVFRDAIRVFIGSWNDIAWIDEQSNAFDTVRVIVVRDRRDRTLVSTWYDVTSDTPVEKSTVVGGSSTVVGGTWVISGKTTANTIAIITMPIVDQIRKVLCLVNQEDCSSVGDDDNDTAFFFTGLSSGACSDFVFSDDNDTAFFFTGLSSGACSDFVFSSTSLIIIGFAIATLLSSPSTDEEDGTLSSGGCSGSIIVIFYFLIIKSTSLPNEGLDNFHLRDFQRFSDFCHDWSNLDLTFL